MKLLTAALLFAQLATAQIAFVAGGGAQSSTGTSVTLSGKNLTSPTNANLIMIQVSSTASTGTMADSQANTYAQKVAFGANPVVQVFCVGAPSVAASMSFTYSCAGAGMCFPTMEMVAYSGTGATGASCAIDQNVTGTNTGSPVVVSFTPAQPNEAWFSAAGNCQIGGTPTTGSGTTVFGAPCVNNVGYGSAAAYGLLSGSPATSVQWSNGGTVVINAAILSILPPSLSGPPQIITGKFEATGKTIKQ